MKISCIIFTLSDNDQFDNWAMISYREDKITGVGKTGTHELELCYISFSLSYAARKLKKNISQLFCDSCVGKN